MDEGKGPWVSGAVRWRTGGDGRAVYVDNELVTEMATRDDALELCELMNDNRALGWVGAPADLHRVLAAARDRVRPYPWTVADAVVALHPPAWAPVRGEDDDDLD